MTAQPLTRIALLAAGIAGALSIAPAAAAHEAGDLFLRAGPALVAPNDSSGNVKVNGTSVPGTGVTVDSATALGLTLDWMVTDHLGVELLASTPFTHHIGGKGLGIREIGSVTQLPPTLSVQWYPLGGSSRLQPYVGVGVNYFMAWGADTSGELDAALGNSRLDVHDSVGLAAQAGVDYAVTDRWSVNAALWYVDVNTEATIHTPTPGFEQIEVDLNVDPLAWMVGMTYRF